jgi:hypothetical protein
VNVHPRDESSHAPDGRAGWCEVFALDYVSADPVLGGTVTVTVLPELGRCWFWACLIGEGRRMLTIVEHDIGARRGLELRAPGLWVEVQCLVPFDHVTVGLEAFALGLDDPSDALGRMWGDRVPFGLDLEWDTDGPLTAPTGAGPTADGYELACRVHGEVLVADERIELDGFGTRRHLWGAPHPWSTEWGRTVRAGGAVAPVPAATGIAEGPLLVRLDDGTAFRLDRTLARVHDASDDAANPLAWIERNRPC